MCLHLSVNRKKPWTYNNKWTVIFSGSTSNLSVSVTSKGKCSCSSPGGRDVCLLAEEAAYRLVLHTAEECRVRGILSCGSYAVCLHVSCMRLVFAWVRASSSAVENGSVPVWSEGEHRAVRVGLPSVRTQRGNGLVGKQQSTSHVHKN